uniref:Uncharacterized protein n=1 Tax=Sphaerodactylus townsendi TaxID=933632 RepID=A0ACB8FC78_9SAUR
MKLTPRGSHIGWTAVIKIPAPQCCRNREAGEAQRAAGPLALQALVVKLDQPANLLRMFFNALYDEAVISEEAFFKWEASKDPAEQQGKAVGLKSVTAFYTWLAGKPERAESDNNWPPGTRGEGPAEPAHAPPPVPWSFGLP